MLEQSSATRFGVLLGTLMLLLILAPPLAEAGYGTIFVGLAYPALLIASAYAVGGRRTWAGRVVLLLTGLAILAEVVIHPLPAASLVVAARLEQAILLGLVAGLVLVHIFSERHVTMDKILGGICVYLLLGILFHSIFALVEFLVPGSFAGPDALVRDVVSGDAHAPLGRHPELLYYSFVTLTTLGYGDITPTWSLPQSLSAAEAIIGQLYLTILVAILVGMHLASRFER